MLNRTALIITYKQPFVDWINTADPSPDEPVTLDDANDDPNVYLIDVIEDEDDFESYLAANYAALFEEELETWVEDDSLWPDDRSLITFRAWVDCSIHTVVLDRGTGALDDDGT